MRRLLAVLLVAVVFVPAPPAAATIDTTIFVHGMGQSADDIGTKQFKPLFDDLQVMELSVFRYVDDIADGGDSQSGVQENADKLAREIAKVTGTAKLIGYSMGGAIIRTYLATHKKQAEKAVDKVVLIDAVASGSWGYAFANEFPRRIEGALGGRIEELLRSTAASSASVDFSRPATRDLRPRSALFRKVAPMALPRNIDYYTFWGDITVVIERGLLHYDLPDYVLPSLGDLGLLPGDPDPTALPELGGQRFSPPVDDDHVALDVPHETKIRLNAAVIRDLLSSCGQKPKPGRKVDCGALAQKYLNVPNTHTAVPNTMGDITVDVPELGGEMSLLDAIRATLEGPS